MIVAGGGRTGTLHVCNGSAGAARWPPSPGLAPGQKIPWPCGPLRVDGAARLPKPQFRLSGSAARLGRGSGVLGRGAFDGGRGWRSTLATATQVGRVGRRFPGSRPERSGSAAQLGPGAARARRGALARGAGRGECVPRSGQLGRVTPTLGSVATIYGCNSPQHGCNSPQYGQSGPEKGFCSPGTGAHPATHAPPPLPFAQLAASGASHPGPGPTGVPHGGDGGSAGAIAHRKPGRRKGARPPTDPTPASGDAPPPPLPPTPAAPAPAPPPPLPPRSPRW
jgi:hypothetical protein